MSFMVKSCFRRKCKQVNEGCQKRILKIQQVFADQRKHLMRININNDIIIKEQVRNNMDEL